MVSKSCVTMLVIVILLCQTMVVLSNQLSNQTDQNIVTVATVTNTQNNLTTATPVPMNVTTSVPNEVTDSTAKPSVVSVNKQTAKHFNKGSSAKKRKAVDVSSIPIGDASIEWRCPNITLSRTLECGCDLPHT